MKQKVILIVKILISVAAIVILLYLMKSSLKSVVETLKSIKISLFAFTALLYFLVVVFMSYRLREVLIVCGINLSLSEVIKLNFIGFFFNNFFITSVGGDIVKAYMIAQDYKHKKVESFAAVIMDRLAGLISLLAIAVISLLFALRYIHNKLLIWLILIILLASIVLVILLMNKKIAKKFSFIINRMNLFNIKAKIKKLYLAIHNYRYYKKVIIKILLLSVILQVVAILIMYVLARSIFISTSIDIFFIMVPLISILSMLPSLNGLGIREGSFVYLLGGFIGKPQALSLSLLWLAILILASIVGGICYILRLRAGYKLKMNELNIKGEML